MSIRIAIHLVAVALVLPLSTSVANGYIHFPPMTLQKMCKISTHIRVLTVKKLDKEKGVYIFEVVETLKGQNSHVKSFRHVVRPDAEGVKPVVDWVADQKRAVAFTIEGGRGPIACGYVFIDEFCYSVDYNQGGDYWLLIRTEPNMSACYHGSVEQLQKLTRSVLDGKEVTVPVNGLIPSKEDKDKRIKEVTDVLSKNRAK